ncbi:MAG: aldo/keto reductase, partial [Puniceicoccales bacterium]
RFGVENIDVLLLHRPDPLMEPEEVARAFDDLQQSGKVAHFGFSNHSAAQIQLLKKCVRQPIVANQLEVSLLHTGMIDAGTAANQTQPTLHEPGEGTLEYCQEHDISIQPWSPLARGQLADEANAPVKELHPMLEKFAADKGVSIEAILLAWLLRHPAKMQPILGSCNPERIAAACRATEVKLTREEWYQLYVTARGQRMA